MERKGIFISIPKNASKTIMRMIGCKNNDGINPSSIKSISSQRFIHDNHARAVVVKDRYKDIFDKSLKFCFIREPFERAKSWYLYHRELGSPPYTSLNFNQWILSDCPHHWGHQNGSIFSKFSFPLDKRLKNSLHPLHQHIFVCNDDGDLLVDNVFQIENLKKDMNFISNTLNYPLVKVDKKVNATKSDKNSVSFSDDAKAHLRHFLRKDFEIFNFEKIYKY